MGRGPGCGTATTIEGGERLIAGGKIWVMPRGRALNRLDNMVLRSILLSREKSSHPQQERDTICLAFEDALPGRTKMARKRT